MQEYRRVPKDSAPDLPPNEIRVSSTRSVGSCIGHAASFLLERGLDPVVMKGLRGAIPTVILSVEMLRRRIPGLEVVWTLEQHNVVDHFEPVEGDSEEVVRETALPSITATLSLNQLDRTQPGYQAPLPPELVDEKSLTELTGKRPPGFEDVELPSRGGRGGRGGRSRGRRGFRGN